MKNKIIITVLTLFVCLPMLSQDTIIDNSERINVNQSSQEFNSEMIEAMIDAKIKILQNQIDSFNIEMNGLKTLAIESKRNIDSLNSSKNELDQSITAFSGQLNNLEKQFNQNVQGLKSETQELESLTSNLSKDLSSAKNDVSYLTESSERNSESIASVNSALGENQRNAMIAVLAVLAIVLITYILLNRKQNNTNKTLLAEQNKIFEQQVSDSQKLTDWLSSQASEGFANSSGTREADHSFAIRVADEIIRITTNLSRMDDSIRGYKQLSASVRKLEQSLNSNGYEIEDLLNKPFDNGMNLQVNFVIDENMAVGESVITRIIKPQINYQGKLIQAAQVEVSQGE